MRGYTLTVEPEDNLVEETVPSYQTKNPFSAAALAAAASTAVAAARGARDLQQVSIANGNINTESNTAAATRSRAAPRFEVSVAGLPTCADGDEPQLLEKLQALIGDTDLVLGIEVAPLGRCVMCVY
jgi:hypothetical protein